jgi:cytochrome c-type biogenesis protein CcmH
MSEDDRRAMIEGMVAGLAARLAEDPDDLDGWLRLIRAYGVMGREDDRITAIAMARKTFADDPAALSRLDEATQ